MTDSPFSLQDEQPEDAEAIEILHEVAFGPGRFARTAYRLREGVEAVEGLSVTAWTDLPTRHIIGSIRYAPVVLNGRRGLMLGPLVVDPEWKGRGVGLALMRTTLEKARGLGHPWAILVGDAPYYGRIGFARVEPGRIRLPGPVDPNRLLFLELEEGSLNGATGLVRAVRWGV